MLYLVPTPIGNLRDITLRSLETLKAADLIVCEDTRRSGKLLAHYRVEKPLLSFHEHSGPGRVEEILRRLREGGTIALISDGGMPLISDPGFEIARAAIREGLGVEALPGPSALVTALAVSGLATDSFLFSGFLPAKSGARQKKIAGLRGREETLLFYESPFRVLKALQEMKEILGDREAVVCRELTKKFEEVSRGYLSELISRFSSRKILGEIVLVVAGAGRKELLH